MRIPAISGNYNISRQNRTEKTQKNAAQNQAFGNKLAALGADSVKFAAPPNISEILTCPKALKAAINKIMSEKSLEARYEAFDKLYLDIFGYAEKRFKTLTSKVFRVIDSEEGTHLYKVSDGHTLETFRRFNPANEIPKSGILHKNNRRVLVFDQDYISADYGTHVVTAENSLGYGAIKVGVQKPKQYTPLFTLRHKDNAFEVAFPNLTKGGDVITENVDKVVPNGRRSYYQRPYGSTK